MRCLDRLVAGNCVSVDYLSSIIYISLIFIKSISFGTDYYFFIFYKLEFISIEIWKHYIETIYLNNISVYPSTVEGLGR